MGRDKKMPTGSDFSNGIERERFGIGSNRLKICRNHLQQVSIKDHFLVGSAQAAFQPSCAMFNQVCFTADSPP